MICTCENKELDFFVVYSKFYQCWPLVSPNAPVFFSGLGLYVCFKTVILLLLLLFFSHPTTLPPYHPDFSLTGLSEYNEYNFSISLILGVSFIHNQLGKPDTSSQSFSRPTLKFHVFLMCWCPSKRTTLSSQSLVDLQVLKRSCELGAVRWSQRMPY